MSADLHVRRALEAALPKTGARALARVLGLGGPGLSLRAAGALEARSGERVRQLLVRLRAAGPLLPPPVRAEVEAALFRVLPAPAGEVAALLGGAGSDPRRLPMLLSVLGIGGIAVVSGVALAVEERAAFLEALEELRSRGQAPVRRTIPGGPRLGPLAAAVAGWRRCPEGWVRLSLDPRIERGLRRALTAAGALPAEVLPAVARRLQPELGRLDGRQLAEALLLSGIARRTESGLVAVRPCAPTPLEARLLAWLRATGPVRRGDVLAWAASAGMSAHSVSDLLRRSPVVASCARGWYGALGGPARPPAPDWAAESRAGGVACRRTASAATLRTGVVACPRGAGLPQGVVDLKDPEGRLLGRVRIGPTSISGLRAPLRRLGLRAGDAFVLEVGPDWGEIRPA
jgi:hypothetical protein